MGALDRWAVIVYLLTLLAGSAYGVYVWMHHPVIAVWTSTVR